MVIEGTTIEILLIYLKIKELLKVDGMTINSVKKHLQNVNSFKLDEDDFIL